MNAQQKKAFDGQEVGSRKPATMYSTGHLKWARQLVRLIDTFSRDDSLGLFNEKLTHRSSGYLNKKYKFAW